MKNSKLDNIIKKYLDGEYSINELNRGYAHKKWIIQINNNILFLKSFNDISDNRIEFINYIQERLNLYTPNIIKNKNHETYTKQDNTTYVAYEFLKGKLLSKLDMSYDMLEKIGSFLGKMHKELSQVQLPQYFTEINNLQIKDDNINKIKDLINNYNNNEYKDYCNILNYKIEILNKISINNVLKGKERLSQQIVHGDFYLDNIIIENNNIKITDLDQVCVFYKMYEVIRGMMMIAYDETLNDVDNIKRIKTFISGYKKENNIEDLNISIDLYLYTLANSLYCLQTDDWKDENKKKFANTRYNMLKWLYNKKTILIKNVEREECER